LRFSWDLLEILNWAKPINPNKFLLLVSGTTSRRIHTDDGTEHTYDGPVETCMNILRPVGAVLGQVAEVLHSHDVHVQRDIISAIIIFTRIRMHDKTKLFLFFFPFQMRQNRDLS
jgi:hypothetical protein